jgi:uncharacterized zinc-type alcohol dehydrogenase-like protein
LELESTMPTDVSAYGALSATEPLVPITIERRDVGPYDVRIDIRFAGICHSDIHTVRGEWGPANYPVVPGHEIAGIVAEVGSEVTRFAVGDRVGVGCLVDSCGECASCRRGEEQYCLNGNIPTYGGVGRDGRATQGGYSRGIVVTERFVCRIPPRRCCARASPPIRRCAAGAPGPGGGSPSSGSAGSGTWRSSWRTRWVRR